MRSLKRLMKSDREVREICKRETDAYLRDLRQEVRCRRLHKVLERPIRH